MWDNGAATGAGIPSNTRWGVNVATVGGTGDVEATKVATVYVLTITSKVTISSNTFTPPHFPKPISALPSQQPDYENPPSLLHLCRRICFTFYYFNHMVSNLNRMERWHQQRYAD